MKICLDAQQIVIAAREASDFENCLQTAPHVRSNKLSGNNAYKFSNRFNPLAADLQTFLEPAVAEGQGLYETAAVCRGEFGRETGKLKSLQGYVRVITKK